MQNKMDTSLSGELLLLLPLRRRREDPCVECLNVLKKLQVCFPEFTKIEFLQIMFTMYSHQKASFKRSRNFILNIPYVLIFLSSSRRPVLQTTFPRLLLKTYLFNRPSANTFVQKQDTLNSNISDYSQRRIQNPVKNLLWSFFLQKQLTAFSR